jgi:hypothetical protein
LFSFRIEILNPAFDIVPFAIVGTENFQSEFDFVTFAFAGAENFQSEFDFVTFAFVGAENFLPLHSAPYISQRIITVCYPIIHS